MSKDNLGFLWHNPTWTDSLPALITLAILVLGFVATVAIWRFLQRESQRWSRLGGLAARRRLSRIELKLLKTFYATLPTQIQDSILADPRRFWQLLFSVSRGQMRTHPLEMLRIITKLFPVLEFHSAITTLGDIKPRELLAVRMGKQNLMARIDSVDSEQRKLTLHFADRGFEVPRSAPVSLYFFRPGFGETRMTGSISITGRGHAVFHLKTDPKQSSNEVQNREPTRSHYTSARAPARRR